MSQPLWRISSGEFAGYKKGDILFNTEGVNIGYFIEDIAYSLGGEYIGELYREGRIGKRTNIVRPQRNVRVTSANIALAKYANRAGFSVAGWETPNF